MSMATTQRGRTTLRWTSRASEVLERYLPGAAVERRAGGGEGESDLFADRLAVRYSLECSIQRGTNLTIELLGVAQPSQQPELGPPFTASRALSYHPPLPPTQAGKVDRLRDGQSTV